MDFSSIQGIDQQILMALNGSENMMLDNLAYVLTSGFTWIPLYLVLLVVVIRNNETMSQIAIIMGGALLCVLLADGLCDGLIKPLTARMRPSVDPLTKYSIQVVQGMRLKGFGFCSAHAANTMSIAVFFSLLVRSKMLTFTMYSWSLVNCWTRLYLGVHYPSDVVCGIVIGVLVGSLVYLLFLRIYRKISPEIKYISNQYTSTGYDHDDIDKIMTMMMLVLVYVLVRSIVMTNYI